MMLVVLWVMAVALVVLAAAEAFTANLSRRQFTIRQEREHHERLAQMEAMLRQLSNLTELYEARWSELRRERAAEKGEQT